MFKIFSSIYVKIVLSLICAVLLLIFIFKTSSKQNDEWKDKVLIVTSDLYDKTVLIHQNTDIDKLEKNNYIKILRYKYSIENFNYENFINDILKLSNKYEPTLIVFCPVSSVYLLKNNTERSSFINTISRPRLVGITSIDQSGFFDCIYQDENSSVDEWKIIAESLKSKKIAFLYNSSFNNSLNIERVFRETNNPNLLILNEYPKSQGLSETETIFNDIKDYDIIITPYINNITNLLNNYKNELKNKKWIVGTNLFSIIDKKNVLSVIYPDVCSIIKDEINSTELKIRLLTDKNNIKYNIKSFDKKYNFSKNEKLIDVNEDVGSEVEEITDNNDIPNEDAK